MSDRIYPLNHDYDADGELAADSEGIADHFMVTAQALGVTPRVRREALERLKSADPDHENGGL